MSNFKNISIFGFLSLFLILKPTYAQYNFPEDFTHKHIQATTVPASSCLLRNAKDGPKVYLSNGAWRFRGSQTGTVHFYCPFPVNATSLYGSFSINQISSFRVWYHDPDAIGRAQRVAARLYARENAFGVIRLKTVGSTFDSNAYNSKGSRFQEFELSGGGSRSLKQHSIYHFGVTMTRNNTLSSPGFIGIDFVDPWSGY